MSAWQKTIASAATHVAKNDPILAPIIKSAGLPTFSPHNNYYGSLVDSIISQQLSVKAAASIEQRFRQLFQSDDFPPPEQILTKDIEQLRSVGLSRAKALYIRDLAQHITQGNLKLNTLSKLTNEEIVQELTAVKGIGEWTAHMFLIFCVGRLDVLPTGDLGIRNGVRNLYGFGNTVTPQQVVETSEKYHWHPYESVASWYLWHSLDNKPSI